MCGIYGMVALGRDPLRAPERTERMGELLAHRGPDGAAQLRSPRAVLGARRLRIRDPRPAADQPFRDPAGRAWLACNGEIYNAAALRARYRDHPFRSRSDVEPLLPLYLDRGRDGIADLDAMFALVVWDVERGTLLLARDRAGEKPLFYARVGDEVWFASEIQALLEAPALARDLDPVAVQDLVALGHVRSPRTAFAAIRSVEPGTTLTFSPAGAQAWRYWDPAAVAIGAESGDATQQLDRLVRRAVAKQVVADVPVGAFTSGGVDSSLVTALAADALGPDRLTAFTVGFPERSYDETPAATLVARHLGCRHITVTATDLTLEEAFETLTSRLAEPVADPAALPTFLLARAAREHVGVVLSGEGADELFGGYPTYVGHELYEVYRRAPRPVLRAMAALLRLLPPSGRKVPIGFLLRRFVTGARADWLERHVAWFGTGLPSLPPGDWLEDLRRLVPATLPSPIAAAMRLDYRTYLPDGLLVKLDRATMLASLEARAPFLDRDVTRCALALPPASAVRGFETKRLLKRVAAQRLPAAVVARRKRGLSAPIGRWINEGFRGEVDRLLAPRRMESLGVLPPGTIDQLLSEHRAGRANHARALWPLIVFERWHQRWVGG